MADTNQEVASRFTALKGGQTLTSPLEFPIKSEPLSEDEGDTKQSIGFQSSRKRPHKDDASDASEDGPATPGCGALEAGPTSNSASCWNEFEFKKDKKRKFFTPEQKTMMREAYEAGLTSYREPEERRRVEALAATAGLTVTQVKGFIDTTKSRARNAHKPRLRRISARMKPKTAKGIFYSRFMAKHGNDLTPVPLLSRAARAWAEAKKNPDLVSELQEEAARRTRVPRELDSEERQAYVRSLTQEVKDMCDKLEEVGVESVVMLLDRRTFHCLGLGSSQGQDFLNIQANTKQQFSDHCTGHISTDAINDVNDRHYEDSGKFAYNRLTSRHVDASTDLKTEDSSDDHVSRGSPGDYAAEDDEDDHDSGSLHDNHIAHSRGGRMDCISDDDDDDDDEDDDGDGVSAQGVACGDFNCKDIHRRDSGGVQASGLSGVHSTHRGGVDGPGSGSALPLRQVLAKRKRRGQVQYQVLAKRKRRGQVQYQVLWVEDLSITWEPASNVPLQLRRGVPYVQDDQRGIPCAQGIQMNATGTKWDQHGELPAVHDHSEKGVRHADSVQGAPHEDTAQGIPHADGAQGVPHTGS